MFTLLFIFAAVAHAQLQPVEEPMFQASEVSTYEAPLVALAMKTYQEMHLSEETKEFICDDFCHHLTTGECQHPNLGDDNCYRKLADNGTCPAGTVECGFRPTNLVPDYPPATNDLIDTRTYLDVPSGMLQRQHLVANDVSLPAYFKLGFKLTPRHTVPRWGSIVHFSKDDAQCCSWGQRIPVIFFRPSTFDFEFAYGTTNHGTRFLNGFPRGDNAIVADVEYDMEFRILPQGAQIFVNGAIIAEDSLHGQTREAFDNVRVWAAGAEWASHAPAGAEVSGLYFDKLSGDEEYPLMS
jgi:hypothetical protein